MKNDAPKGRSLDKDNPLTIAPIECSRIPKCRFFPLELSAWKSPAPAKVKVVLFDGPRSAEPPRNHGMFCASTFNTLPDASRPAMPIESAENVGRFRSQPAGSSRRCINSTSVANSGYLARYEVNNSVHSEWAFWPRAPM